jgi:uncharacterized membrane protein
MAAYHLSWDLADFRLAPQFLPFTPPMRMLSHVVASAFLALVGVSLALAHRGGVNLPAFWRRLALVAAAAALVTAASFFFAPGLEIWFGILHCIVAASLLALPLLRAAPAASLLAGAVAIALPFFVQSPLFNPPALLWIGLGVALPSTVDWYPLLPWAGATLLGLGLARLPPVMGWLTSPMRWRAASGPTRALCFAGRHSLAVYLIHQPILTGVVAAALWLGVPTLPEPKPDPAAFVAACTRACVAGGRAEEDCDSSCRCVKDAIEDSGDADKLGSGALDADRKIRLKRLADACMGR